jgi:FkbM family methyltransferase
VRFSYAPPGASTSPVTVRLDGMAPDDHIAREISRAGSFYELDLLEHLAVHAPPGGTYVDAGANIGNHTVYFARFLADRVVAVEANPDVVPVLRANLEGNGLTNVDIVGCAVGAAAGQGVLVVPAGMEHNVGAWEIHADAGGSAGQAAVRIRPLDDILGEALGPAERVHLIKLDVEGMELPALQGA